MIAFEDIFNLLLEYPDTHIPGSPKYQELDARCRAWIGQQGKEENWYLGPLGTVKMPYTVMGNVTSADLFGLNELILFAFYWRNRKRYRYHNVLDIGANLGLHSIVMDRCGWDVDAFEPDPSHFEKLTQNLQANREYVRDTDVDSFNLAVSDFSGQASFTIVDGNHTANHLTGMREYHGKAGEIQVGVTTARRVIANADFAKIDAEGSEAKILLDIPFSDWDHLDAMVEIGSVDKAETIFDHFCKSGVNLFSQKTGWKRVEYRSRMDCMPTHHRDGALFISRKGELPW